MPILKLDIPTTAASADLHDWGPVGLPLSEPPCHLRGTKLSDANPGAPEIGIWECTPGRFRRQVRSAEMMEVLHGEALFTPDDGPSVRLRAGDVCHFPAETMGVWDIETTLRKVYVLLPAG